jgi:hypothetical protein
MFAQLMGLKTIAPDDLHRLLQGPGNVSIYDINSRQRCSNPMCRKAPNAARRAKKMSVELDVE